MDARPKILIVDDKPENLVALEVVLRDMEIDLIKATSGNQALKETLHHDFALALLDIQMPEMDGYELAGILREEEKTAHLPFIFISAVYTDNLNVFKGYEKGAFSFITKPFQPEILINKVKFFIEKHQQEIALYKLNKNLEQKNLDLLNLNKELEAFSYSVSHDLRSPLLRINGFANILVEDYLDKLSDEAMNYLNSIIDNTRKMSQLIDSLLLLSKVGKTEIKKANIDMATLLSETINELKPDNSVSINVIAIDNITGDKNLLKQVFVNLISNAIKYSGKKDNPVIEIGCKQLEEETTYYIKDNGTGFDMKYYDKLFGVFQRLHSQDEFEGTGIGLATVQRIIDKHGGKIWAEGKINEGATFYFSLPKSVQKLI